MSDQDERGPENDLLVELSNGVYTMTLNRPRKSNSITPEMTTKIIHNLNVAAENDDIKVCVLTSIGNMFSGGNDFSSVNVDDVTTILANFQKLVDTLIFFPKILVAVLPGPAIGMACTVLALFDIVYASENVYFQTPFTLLGLSAEGCSSYTFPRIFGPAKAAKLLYLNEAVQAEEAASVGFVTDVFSKEDLASACHQAITELASYPLQSLMETKRLIRARDHELLHRINKEEVATLYKRFYSDDFLKAITNSETFKKIKSKL